MRHLTADEFVDLADGTRADASVPHLGSCDACRQQLDELRETLALAAAADVPEPSPLFWDHFSERVRGAVAAGAAPRRAWWVRAWQPVLAASAAAAAIVLAVAIVRVSIPQAPPRRATIAADPVRHETFTEIDDSLTLVAELSANLDFDGAREAGLAAGGSAEHAVTHLNDGELRELRRLIAEEMENP